MKKVEFRPGELSDRAFTQYSGSDLYFWKDNDGVYYVGETKGTSGRVGTIEEVEEYLISLEYEDE